MKTILLTILFFLAGVTIVLAAVSYFGSQKTAPDGENLPPASQEPNGHIPSEGDVRLSAPEANSIVTSPLEVAGEVCCGWFFEGEFPISIEDQNGNVLGQTSARAVGDWMTSNYVPFTGSLEFSQGAATAGYLVLAKNNPSDLREHDYSVKIPVRFESLPTTALKVFFGKEDETTDCGKVYPVERVIPKTLTPARASLDELLKGPTVVEKQSGYFASINPGVKIQRLAIEDGIAKVDFDEQLESSVGGSCRVANIRSQITETLKQFSTVTDVIISINGRTENILQP